MARRSIRQKRKNVGGDNVQNKGTRQNYVLSEIDKNNEKFTKYYRSQGIVGNDEWEQFISTLRKDLPTSFRVRGSSLEAELLIEIMRIRYFMPMLQCDPEEKVDVPKQLSWFPYAFQTSMSRTTLRSHPILKEFHNFLVTEAELGNISRQEAVSMIPPLLLDLESHHKVLDVCAAPGSKTMQIIEMMHLEKEIPGGLIVANDSDNSRCYLLVRQALKRTPTSNCIVINGDAAFLPRLKLNTESDEPLLFDRVLCDVMCSGDGTFRKSPDLWNSWSPGKGLGLHKLQVNIAKRSVQLLAANGIMVYSTCSLNPIEDEAVVASLLRNADGALELVDVSEKLSSLKRSPGISSWKVFDKEMQCFSSYDDAQKNQNKLITKSMFPPNEEEKEKFHLERCFRILPHFQNTGGFFVAVLRKTKVMSMCSQPQPEFRIPPMKKKRTFKEDPFVFLEDNDPRWEDISNHYGINDTFPFKNLFGRTVEETKKRTLYFVNDAVKQFMLSNQEKVKVINAGIRMFGRVENKYDLCRFRMSQDGVRTILPYLQKRVVNINPSDMCKILKTDNGNENYPREKLSCDAKLAEITSGSVALVTELNGFKQVICSWLGAKSIAPYVGREERIHALRMLGVDTVDLEDALLSKRQSKAMRERELAGKQTEICEVVKNSEESPINSTESSGVECAS